MTFKELLTALHENSHEAYGIIEHLPDDLEGNIRVSLDDHGGTVFKGDIVYFSSLINVSSWKLIPAYRTYYLSMKYRIAVPDDDPSKDYRFFDELRKILEKEKAHVISIGKQELVKGTLKG